MRQSHSVARHKAANGHVGGAAYAACSGLYIFENSFQQARLKFIAARAALIGAVDRKLCEPGLCALTVFPISQLRVSKLPVGVASTTQRRSLRLSRG